MRSIGVIYVGPLGSVAPEGGPVMPRGEVVAVPAEVAEALMAERPDEFKFQIEVVAVGVVPDEPSEDAEVAPVEAPAAVEGA